MSWPPRPSRRDRSPRNRPAGAKRASVGGSFARAALGGFIKAALEVKEKGTFDYTAEDRDPAFPIAYHYTRAAADADAASRGGPPSGLQGKFDGYEVGDHGTLLEAYEKGFITDDEAQFQSMGMTNPPMSLWIRYEGTRIRQANQQAEAVRKAAGDAAADKKLRAKESKLKNEL